MPYNTETIRVTYRSKYNHKRKMQVILLTITDGNKQHYLAVSNLLHCLQKKSSDHDRDLYCLNCFNSYIAKNRLKEHEKNAINTTAVV